MDHYGIKKSPQTPVARPGQILSLASLPDLKTAPDRLTIGKRYMVRRCIGNGVVVLQDDGKGELLVMDARFGEAQ